MQMQSVFGALSAPMLNLVDQRSLSGQFRIGRNQALKNNKVVGIASSSCLQLRLKGRINEPFRYRQKRVTTRCCSSSDVEPVYIRNSAAGVPNDRSTGLDPFRGKSGSVSFHGLTYQLVEATKLESAPFAANQGTLLWLVAPVALISSLVLPQLVVGNVVDVFFENKTLAAFVSSMCLEAIFYLGLATFLGITDGVQRPYLEFSPKRWGLITGLRGYLLSAYITMGLKVVLPVFVVYVFWPVIGFQAVVAVAPFLFGCLAQLLFEQSLDKKGSSCWPLVPIIFELYRLYQLTKAASYVEMLVYALKDLPPTPELYEKSSSLVAIIVSCQVLGLICLWSLVTFLLRLFPSRPVAENY